ncbi:MAG: recombinase family protein, partial [Candidatus Thermoplasmatota archaeon]
LAPQSPIVLLPKDETRPAFIVIPTDEESEGERKRFRILARVSDDKLRSIPQQVKECAEYAMTQGAIVDGIYNVGEHSGFSMSESAIYQQCLEDAKAGRYHGLVVRDTSRLGRDYWEKLGTLRDLRAAKVELHVIEDGGRFDFDDRMSKVKSWASTWADEQKKSEEIRKSIRATDAVREAGLPTLTPPFGYKLVRDARAGRRVWRAHEHDAATVRAIFEAVASGEHAGLTALGRQHSLTYYQVDRMLTNRAYTGGFTWKGKFTRSAPEIIEPLVSEELFERAQAARKRKRA